MPGFEFPWSSGSLVFSPPSGEVVVEGVKFAAPAILSNVQSDPQPLAGEVNVCFKPVESHNTVCAWLAHRRDGHHLRRFQHLAQAWNHFPTTHVSAGGAELVPPGAGKAYLTKCRVLRRRTSLQPAINIACSGHPGFEIIAEVAELAPRQPRDRFALKERLLARIGA